MNEEEVNNQEENDHEPSADEQVAEESQSERTDPTAEDKFNELNDRYLRLYAEFENYRKRSNKEKVDLISNASAGVLKDILPVLDDFERAIVNNQTSEDIEAVKEGFLLIQNKLKSILEGKGLTPMEAKGTRFDPDLHEAIANVPAPSEEEKGMVIDDVEKGYYLHEKVIRYAKVVVGQ
jgi:molecular chaperone GrpE